MTTQTPVSERFNAIADRMTRVLGSMQALIGSVALVVVWALTGPLFKFSDTWQLFINTSTTVITFWMVFVIQNSANREAKATQLKLDEVIRALGDARNEFIALDRAPERVLAEREEEFAQIANARDHEALNEQGMTAARRQEAEAGSTIVNGRDDLAHG